MGNREAIRVGVKASSYNHLHVDCGKLGRGQLGPMIGHKSAARSLTHTKQRMGDRKKAFWDKLA